MLASSVRAIVSINLQCCSLLGDETLVVSDDRPLQGCYVGPCQGSSVHLHSCPCLCRQALSSHPLERLDMTGCTAITDKGMQALSKVSTLTSLSLAHCYFLTDDSVTTILRLQSLRSLDMRDCLSVSPVGRERILKRYPHADVTIS